MRRFGIEMFGRLVAGLIVVGLAVGVWVLWPRDDVVPPTTTIPEAIETTPPDSSPTTTTTPTTSTTEDGVVTTVEEAETILSQFWFGWFEGIYNQDEDRIKEVVASQPLLDAAKAQFGVMEFTAQPTPDGIALDDLEILLSTEMCLAIWSSVGTDFRPGQTQGVHVFRRVDMSWRLVNLWPLEGDLWEEDCEAQLEPLS